MGFMSQLDLSIVVGYFAIVFIIGLVVARKTETGSDLFLAGRSLGFVAIGFSLFASNISSTTIIGLAGAAYKSGIAVSNYEWMAGVVLVFMAAFYIPVYLKSRITTIPEFLELRFNRKVRLYFSAITIFLSVVIDMAGGLYAGGLVIKVFFPAFEVWQTSIILAIIAGLYTAAGGLKAVVYTDVLQAIVLLVGTAMLSYLVFERFDFDWTQATGSLPDGHLSLIRPIDDSNLPWLGTLTGVPILGFWYWATNQYITQRILGAKDLPNARWGAVLGGCLKLIPLFTMVIPGAMALSLFPNLENPDTVFPTLVKEILPSGVVGLVIAGLIAAIMSSVDSQLNSASTLIVCDFVQRDDRKLSEKETARWGRRSTLTLMIVAALFAPLIAHLGGLFAYLQQAFAILVPPVAALFLIGLFWKKGTAQAAFQTLLIGHVLGLVLFILGQVGIWNLHFTITTGIVTGFSLLLFVVISLAKPEIKESGLEHVWNPQLALPTAGLSWYQDYRIYGGIVLLLTAIMLVNFW